MDKIIAIIEDEKKLLDLFIFNLKEDYNIKGWNSADSFLQDYIPQRFAMIITDIRMPGMNGIELLKYLKEKSPEIPVIVMTAYGSIDQAVLAIKIGAYDYLTKPVKIKILKETIERVFKFKSSIIHDAPLFPVNSDFITQNPVTLEQCSLAAKVSGKKIPVLILGETGTGKEIISELIHKSSGRKGKFVKINCAAIPAELLEGELFGYKKGAFTGANQSYEGKIALSHEGTLFLDEIGDFPEALQAKLLHVIEDESFYPLGDNRLCKVDLRIIAATNKNLKEEMEKGNFRSDLYYRLAVVTVRMPPLRERPEDITIIAKNYFKNLFEQGKTKANEIDDAVFSMFKNYPWPGNVRELRNVITHMALLSEKSRITVKQIPKEFFKMEGTGRTLPYSYEEFKRLKQEIKNEAAADFEIQFIQAALIRNNWNISRTAAAIGIDRRYFQNMIKKYKIQKIN